MAINPNNLLGTFNAIASVVGRLLPIIEHIPNSLGKWVAPVKAMVKANEQLAAKMLVGVNVAKALGGRLSKLDAIMTGFHLRTAGASRKMAVLGSLSALALNKINLPARRAAKDIAAIGTAGDSAGKKLVHLGAVAAKTARSGSAGGSGLFGGGVGKIVAAVGGYRLLHQAIAGVNGVLSLSSKLLDDSTKTGIDPKSLLILQRAGKESGIEEVTGHVNKMQAGLVEAAKTGSGPAAEALGYLGLKAHDLLKQSPVEQLQAMGAALRGIKQPELKTALVRDLFGKGGNELLPLLEDAEALDNAQRALGSQANLLVRNAAAFKRVSDQLNRAGVKLQGFFVGLTASILPALQAAAERLNSLDLASQGERFGAGVKIAVNFLAGAFADPGSLFDAAIGYLKAGLLGAGNLLIAGISVAGNLLGSESFFGRLATGFEGLGKIILGTLMDAFAGPVRFLQDGIEFALGKARAVAVQVNDKLTPGGTPEVRQFEQDAENVRAAKQRMRAKMIQSGELIGGEFQVPRDAAAAKKLAGINAISAGQDPRVARTFAQVQRDNAGSGSAFGIGDGQTAAAMIAEGKAKLKDNVGSLFDSAAAAFRAAKIEDVLGAGEELAKAARTAAGMIANGAKVIAAAIPPAAAQKVAKNNPFADFATASSAASLRSSGLTGASMAGGFGEYSASDQFTGKSVFDFSRVANLSKATAPKSLLSHSELNAFETARVAAGGKRGARGGAFAAVHAGDAQRSKEAAREREREKLKAETGIEKSNTLLDEIRTASERTAAALAGPSA